MNFYSKGQRILKRSAFSEFFSSKDKYTIAIELYKKAEAIVRETSPALADGILVEIAEIYNSQYDHRSAAEYYASATGTQPDNYSKAGNAFELAFMPQLAADAYTKYAEYLTKNGELVLAIPYYTLAGKYYPDSLLNAADLCVRAELYSRALGIYNSALKVTSRNDIIPLMILCYIAMRDYVSAKRLLRISNVSTQQTRLLKAILLCVDKEVSVTVFNGIMDEYISCITEIMHTILMNILDE